jgi:hypothetical protein
VSSPSLPLRKTVPSIASTSNQSLSLPPLTVSVLPAPVEWIVMSSSPALVLTVTVPETVAMSIVSWPPLALMTVVPACVVTTLSASPVEPRSSLSVSKAK